MFLMGKRPTTITPAWFHVVIEFFFFCIHAKERIFNPQSKSFQYGLTVKSTQRSENVSQADSRNYTDTTSVF